MEREEGVEGVGGGGGRCKEEIGRGRGRANKSQL